MRCDLPFSVWVALALATAVLLVTAGEARAQSGEQWCVDRETATEVRDKARAYEALCEALPGSEVDADLSALCDDASGASRIWSKAQITDEARQAAREAQRQANVREGRLTECQTQSADQNQRVERLSGTVGEQKAKLQRQVPKWVVYAVGAGAVLAGGGAGYLVGKITP
jgi:hypothetical protein